MNKQSIRKNLQAVKAEVSCYPHVVKAEYNRRISELADLCVSDIDDQIAGALDDVAKEAFSAHDRSEIDFAFEEVKALYEHVKLLHGLTSEYRANLHTIVARLITEKNEGKLDQIN